LVIDFFVLFYLKSYIVLTQLGSEVQSNFADASHFDAACKAALPLYMRKSSPFPVACEQYIAAPPLPKLAA
jgi:hypothetical protein